MIALYLIFGIVVATIGAVPVGAVNIAVINTSIKENIKKASYVALAAGVGEVVLAIFALHCSMQVSSFFKENVWIQIMFSIIFFLAGIYFIFIAQKNLSARRKPKFKLVKSKFLTGFSLAILNPPVIIYWVVSITIINKYFFELTAQTSVTALVFFFSGIYLGKIGILYLYGKWGNKMAQKQDNSKARLHKIIGVALLSISIFQGFRVLFT